MHPLTTHLDPAFLMATTENNSGSMTAIVAIVAVVAVLLIVYFVFLRGGVPGTQDRNINVDINPPTVQTPSPN